MSKSTVFICEDDENINLLLYHNISQWGYEVHTYFDGEKILTQIQNKRPDVIILDINLPVKSGVTVLEESRKIYPNLPVIIVSGQGKVTTALDVMRLGAYDYLPKPIDLERLELLLRNAAKQSELYAKIEELRSTSYEFPYSDIIAKSEGMRKVFRMISKIHDTDNAVLLYGETGVGKELLARAIHYYGKRKDGPFVVVNCAAIPRELLESEFFGHEKGAFTGAYQRKIGKFEQAHQGTIFLDEVGEMDLSLQAKLLRLLQTKTFERIGGNETISVDTRIVSATNKNLQEEIKHRLFREDLYFRLSSFPITIPPLRERKTDVLLLAEEFLTRFTKRYGKSINSFSRKALAALLKYSFPGNVRELENLVEHAVIMCDTSMIELDDLPDAVRIDVESNYRQDTMIESEILPLDFVKKQAISQALHITEGNLVETAHRLQIGRSTLYRLMEKYGISV
ncbi:MAG TPA: sigma-54 dependent transcriptional regulator [Candidatus Kapabacteria bacterium]|jgi:two-component system response regulator AtoC|nr:sigma-54 dependent transcriptional regulator [Candidatus Kapabacteria bacterium]HRK59135.1 sigma-54 dependent transcriptional regulator [Candidatus Kapabacteria bacterium]